MYSKQDCNLRACRSNCAPPQQPQTPRLYTCQVCVTFAGDVWAAAVSLFEICCPKKASLWTLPPATFVRDTEEKTTKAIREMAVAKSSKVMPYDEVVLEVLNQTFVCQACCRSSKKPFGQHVPCAGSTETDTFQRRLCFGLPPGSKYRGNFHRAREVLHRHHRLSSFLLQGILVGCQGQALLFRRGESAHRSFRLLLLLVGVPLPSGLFPEPFSALGLSVGGLHLGIGVPKALRSLAPQW